MKFLDQAKIYVKSGDGGSGCVSFRREKYIAFGGPNGGDGGRGGDVVVIAVPGLNTLIDFRYRQHIKGGSGHHGEGRNRTGAAGANVVIKVPVGTEILEERDQPPIADLTEAGQQMVLVSGGAGGRGNARFKTSVNQAPRRADPGAPGEERWLWLRLKLIADAGLIGLPNAGKSTFLAAVSRARPKIADYPFTTLTPVLGVVSQDDREFVLADIPGLIEGAHEGAGLGDRFLGHVERCRVLLHLIDGTTEDVILAYHAVRKEIKAYGRGIEEKREIVALNKLDSLTPEDATAKRRALEAASSNLVLTVSGATGQGTQEVLRALLADIDKTLAAEPSPAHEAFSP